MENKIEICQNWKGGTVLKKNGHIMISINNKQIGEHRLMAEKVLGKKLPKKAVVHHYKNHGKGQRTDLVICQNQAYHNLLHSRERAYRACGNANYRKCRFCKKYDYPIKMYIRKFSGPYHRECRNKSLLIKRRSNV